MDASPYYLSLGRGNDSEFKTYDALGNPAKMPLFYDNYFVPRGYAFVAPDMAGTGRSTGCADQGGRSDIESIKVVVEWLNGNAVARDAQGDIVEASWMALCDALVHKSLRMRDANDADTATQVADTAAQVADTATQAADTATQAADTTAQAADTAAQVARGADASASR